MDPEEKSIKDEIKMRLKETPKMKEEAEKWHREWCRRHLRRGDIIEIKKESQLWNVEVIYKDEAPIDDGEPCQTEEPEEHTSSGNPPKHRSEILHIAPRYNRVDRELRKNLAKRILDHEDLILTPNRHYMKRIKNEPVEKCCERILNDHKILKERILKKNLK